MKNISDIDYQKTKNYWDSIGDFYNNFYSIAYRGTDDEEIDFYHFKKHLDFIRRYILLYDIKTVNFLDVGCGPGNFIDYLKDNFDTLKGIDQSEYMINIARKRFQKFPNIIIEKADINTYTLQENKKYDLIFIGGVFLYIKEDDVIKFLKKIKGVIDNNSIVVVRDVNVRRTQILQDKNDYMIIRRSIGDIKKIFGNAGLEIVSTERNYYFSYTRMIELYKKYIGRSILRVELFDNKIIEFFLLYLPLMLFLLIMKNPILEHFFVLKKRKDDIVSTI